MPVRLYWWEEYVVMNFFVYVLFFLSFVTSLIAVLVPNSILMYTSIVLASMFLYLAWRVFQGRKNRKRIYCLIVRRFEAKGVRLEDFKGKCGEPCLWVQAWCILRRFGCTHDWFAVMRQYAWVRGAFVQHPNHQIEELINFGGNCDFNTVQVISDSIDTHMAS